MIVSDGLQRDSAIHKHVSILLQTPFSSRLPHNTKQSSLCYTVSCFWLSILNTVVPTTGYYTALRPSRASLVAQRKRISLQCRRLRRHWLALWVMKIPWRRPWQPTPVFLPGESPWTEEPAGLRSAGWQTWTQLK